MQVDWLHCEGCSASVDDQSQMCPTALQWRWAGASQGTWLFVCCCCEGRQQACKQQHTLPVTAAGLNLQHACLVSRSHLKLQAWQQRQALRTQQSGSTHQRTSSFPSAPCSCLRHCEQREQSSCVQRQKRSSNAPTWRRDVLVWTDHWPDSLQLQWPSLSLHNVLSCLVIKGLRSRLHTWTSLRVSRSSSRSLSVWGSTVMPPLAPPKGTPITAVFHVINEARLHAACQSEQGASLLTGQGRQAPHLRTSSRSTSFAYRRPPLNGPLLSSCCTLSARSCASAC